MYEASFGLGPAPFRLLPDPRFYLDEGQYGKLLAQLVAGLEAGEPCLLLTGPSGSGKTAAVQRLLMLLARTRWTAGAMFASADAAGTDVLHAVSYAFSLPRTDAEPGAAFDAWLSSQTARGSRVLLVVDEAEHLDEGALRQLAQRLVPARGAPGLQLCLVGEQAPAALADAVSDGLLPPVAVHCRLRALDAAETRDYVLHRLRRAGWKGRPAFDQAATDAIHRRSEGIPRRIHLIADRVLLQLSLDDSDVATAAAVELADDRRTVELQGHTPIEVPRAGSTAPPRAGSIIGTIPPRQPQSAQRIELPVPPVPPGPRPPAPRPPLPPLPPRQTPPGGPGAVSPVAASDGTSPGLPGGSKPGGTPSADLAGADAMRVLPPPRRTAAYIARGAGGAILLTLAAIGLAWWLAFGRAAPPAGAPRNPTLESARTAVVAPDRRATGEVAAPVVTPAEPAITPAPADPAPPIESPAPALPTVTAEPGPVAEPAPQAPPEAAPPPPETDTAATGAGEVLPAPPVPPVPPVRPSTGRAPAPGSDREALPRSPPRETRRATGSVPAQTRQARQPLPATAASPASPTPAICTRAAAVLGLCEPTAAQTQPAPPPARTAGPAAAGASPEPSRTAPPAAPAAPCEPSRAALGLCER